jgi:ComF family protein
LVKKTPLEEGLICPGCRTSTPLFTSLYSLSPYTPRAKEIIHRMKYLKDSTVAKCLGRQLALFLTGAAPFLIGDYSVIIPVPLTLGKLFKRGFNQSALMGKHLARLTGIHYMPRGLRRVAEFSSQAGRPAGERPLLTEGVFRIHSLNLEGRKNIILIDDVATTLATLNACTKALLDAFGKRISVFAVTAARSL